MKLLTRRGVLIDEQSETYLADDDDSDATCQFLFAIHRGDVRASPVVGIVAIFRTMSIVLQLTMLSVCFLWRYDGAFARHSSHVTTRSFRAGDDFAEQTRSLASIVGLKSSEYIRQAVLEKNARVMAQRIDGID
jgi:hypothetical protein